MLCLKCDGDKTASRPDAASWQRLFIQHCDAQIARLQTRASSVPCGTIEGYEAARARASMKLEILRVKGFA
jgi:hypothetical protein